MIINNFKKDLLKKMNFNFTGNDTHKPHPKADETNDRFF